MRNLDLLPGWTCPTWDRLAGLVAAHVPEPDRTGALLMIEMMRVGNAQLRHVATGSNPKRAAKEVAIVEARIAALEAQLASLVRAPSSEAGP